MDAVEVIRDDGQRGTVVQRISTPAGVPQLVAAFADGSRLVVPEDVLVMQPDGTYHLRLNHSTPINQVVVMEAVMEEPLVVPVVAEELTVEKRRVARGIVRVRTRIETRQEVVDEPLLREEVMIEPDARRLWEEKNPDSWEQVKDAILFSWEQVRGTH